MNDPKEHTNIEIEDKLRSWFSDARKVVIAGIGNPLRKDDFVGIRIVRDLENNVPPSVHLIECETVPESFLESITELNPSHILIIDAALLNLEPGTPKLVTPKELRERQVVSTHAIPLQIFCQYLAQTIKAKIALLVIQPKDSSFGEGLTQKLENTAKRLAKLLSRMLSK